MQESVAKGTWKVEATMLTRPVRRHKRAELDGFVGDIADGNNVLGGVVTDVSESGFKMSQVPDVFTADKLSYTTVISGKGRHFRVLVKPCWSKKLDSNGLLEVGFKIVDAPWEWSEMVFSHIPKRGAEKAWGFYA